MLQRSRGPALVLIALLALLTVGCGGKKEHGALVGWAIAGDPLVGATITAVDENGKVIATSPAKTLRTGTWYLPVDGPPKTFMVVATGGKDNGRPFNGSLTNLIRSYDFKSPRAIHVNPATTLESAYLVKHAKATDDQAIEA